jgi:hypothetical protein
MAWGCFRFSTAVIPGPGLGITLAIAVIGNVGMWAIIVIMPAVQREFGIDRADASLPYTMTMVGFALGNLLIGVPSTGSGSPRR